MKGNLAALESRVSHLEIEVQQIRNALLEPAAVLQPEVPAVRSAPVLVPAVPIPAAQAARASSTFDFEQFFGGRFLLGAGGLAFLVGVAFFLKYAFDNGWIGPSGRVALGLAGGVLLIFASEWILRTGKRYYAEALAGVGAAVLYLSLWAAGSFFHLLPLAVTFGAMALVTAAIMGIALRRDNERLAFVALIGGFLTPALNASDTVSLTFLFTYLTVLGTALLWLGRARWPRLEITAFAATQIYFFGEIPLFTSSGWTYNQTLTVAFATIFLLQYSLVPIIRARRFGSLHAYECAIVAIGATLFYLTLHLQLFETHRHILTVAIIALAAGYLALAEIGTTTARSTFAAISLALITIGVGVTFTDSTMATVWAVEGGALMVLGVRRSSTVLGIFGLIAYACAIVALPAAMTSGGVLFANPRFATLVTFAISLGAVAWASGTGRTIPSSKNPNALRDLGFVTQAAANAFFLSALGLEVYKAFHGSPLAISLLMLAYAVALVAGGFAMKRDFIRWEGLVLFAALVAKVFLVDLSSLDTIVRIVSFLAVGGVLLLVAFAYQRRTQAEQP